MKNWIKFEYGHYLSMNGLPPIWQSEGIVYVDANAITHITTVRSIEGEGCIIYVNSDKNQIVVADHIDNVKDYINEALSGIDYE